MPINPNNISQFWNELKRRKVIHVIIVYATTAFVVIELVNNVYETLNLPEWTPALTIIIFVIGFPLVIIFSWIFDITSKGIVMTKPSGGAKKKRGNFSEPGSVSQFENSIVVLPFEDMSPNKDQEYFCDGITEEIINTLAHLESLKVIARTSAFAFKGKQKDMREIGKKLDVETLLEGSIRKDGNKLRISAQLIKAKDGSHIWSDRYDRDMKDVFAIQDEISRAIVDTLKIKLLGEAKSVIVKRPTENLDVYKLYLKAKYNFHLATPEAYDKALGYLGQALQIEPGFALGYASLGGIYIMSSFYGNVPPNEGYPKAREYSMKALELDNTLAETHSNLGGINMYYDWNWKDAEQELKEALKINPNNAGAHDTYSWFLTFTGRPSDAIIEAERAVELDPLNVYFNAQLGLLYMYNHKFEKAIKQLKWAITMYPNNYLGYFNLGMTYRSMLKIEEAIEEYKVAVKLSGGIPMVVSLLAMALFETGNSEEAESLFNSLDRRLEKEYVPALCSITYHLFKGDHDQAFKCLERAIHEHDTYLPFSVALPIKEYRIPNEPRYATLMKKVGLDKYYQND